MKLGEIMESVKQGTYAGVRFSQDTKDAVNKFLKDNNIPKPVNVEKLHTTLLYSRKHLPNYKPAGKLEAPLVGTPDELVVWKTQADNGQEQSNCLVMKYTCPKLVQRHKDLMEEHDATFDYAEYNPHITLSYDIGDLDITKLQDVKKTIRSVDIVEEYAESLSLDWANKAHDC